jgi:hypothetical protein
MKRAWWRTGPPISHTQPISRPTSGQLLRQLILLAFILLIWGGGFFLFLNATHASGATAGVAVSPTNTAEPAPTNAPTLTASNTSAPSVTRPPTKLAATATSAPTPPAAPTQTPMPVATPTVAATVAGGATTAVSFQRDVQPIFDQICVKCHGGEKTQKDLVLKTFDDLMQGSEDGPVIEPGDPGNSLLIDMIVKGKMPKNAPKLLPAQIRVITDWIKEGALNN